MVTAGTLHKAPILNTPAHLDLVHSTLLNLVQEFQWDLKAWAVFRNHYHFIAQSETPEKLSKMIGKLHMTTAKSLNLLDSTPGRQVWFQYWDSLITYPQSYLARLAYVHSNPVRHGLVPNATLYPWCSANWFVRTAPPAFVNMLRTFKTDRVHVPDDF